MAPADGACSSASDKTVSTTDHVTHVSARVSTRENSPAHAQNRSSGDDGIRNVRAVQIWEISGAPSSRTQERDPADHTGPVLFRNGSTKNKCEGRPDVRCPSMHRDRLAQSCHCIQRDGTYVGSLGSPTSASGRAFPTPLGPSRHRPTAQHTCTLWALD